MIDYKEYAKQMRKNNIAVNGILQVAEELWLQTADIIDDLAEKQIPKKPTPHTVEAGGVKIGNGIWKKGTTIHKCPSCNGFVTRFYRHCTKCGQSLDWGQEE